MGFPLTRRSMTLDDLELLYGHIILENLFSRQFACLGGNNS